MGKVYRRVIEWFKAVVLGIAYQEAFHAKIALHYHLKKRTPKKTVFILCYPRTGSNLLISNLNSVPGVFVGGEILSRRHRFGRFNKFISKETVLNHVRYFANYHGQKLSGNKIFFFHLKTHGLSLKEVGEAFPDACWIVLYRKNILDQYISYKIAHKTGRWGQTRSSDRPQLDDSRVDLFPKSALGYQERVQKSYREVLTLSRIRERSLWINYEELTTDPQQLFDEAIFPFLGLDSSPVSTDLIRQNIWRYSEILSNYDQVKNFVERADFTQNYARHPKKNGVTA